MQVAQEILRQLGGGRFVAMTGASQIVGDDKALQFRIPLSRKGRINKFRIVLEPTDTYTVKAYRVEQPGKSPTKRSPTRFSRSSRPFARTRPATAVGHKPTA